MAEGRMILCSKNALLREGLKFLFTGSSTAVVGEVRSLVDALTLLRSGGQNPNLIVAELTGDAGLEYAAMNEIVREFSEISIVMLADRIDPEGFDLALAAGVRGYLPRDISPAALSTVVKLVLLGENILAAPVAVTRRSLDRPILDLEPTSKRPSAQLSARESQILSCLSDGLPNKIIARKLGMAEATVKLHLKAVLRKINVQNRTQAAVWAMNNQASASSLAA